MPATNKKGRVKDGIDQIIIVNIAPFNTSRGSNEKLAPTTILSISRGCLYTSPGPGPELPPDHDHVILM